MWYFFWNCYVMSGNELVFLECIVGHNVGREEIEEIEEIEEDSTETES